MDSVGTKVKHGIKWQFIANTSGQAVYFAIGIALARILMPKDFGIYGMAQVLSMFIFIFWNLGLNAAIIQRKKINDYHLHTAFTICVVMGVICFVVLWVAAKYLSVFFNEPSVTPLTRIMGITFIIYALDRVPSALLNRNMHFKRVSLLGLINPLVYGVIAVPLALSGFGPFSFAWGVVAGAAIMMVLRIYWSFKLFEWRPKLMVHKESFRNLMGFGVFITLSSIVNFFSWNIQRIIIGKFMGAINLGYFTRASNLGVLPVKNVQANVTNVLLPGFSSIQESKASIRDWFRKFNFFTYAVISPPLLFFSFFPNEVIGGIFGEKWLPSSPLLIWLSLSILITGSGTYFINILQAVGKVRVYFMLSLISVLSVAIGVLVGMRWGIQSIAVAILVANIITFSSYMFILQRYQLVTFRDFIISSFEPVLVSLLACVITVFYSNFFGRYIDNYIFKLSILVFIFGGLVGGYYFGRWLKKSEIVYLDFNVRDVVRL